MAKKTVSDEEIIAALLTHGTQRAAAAAIGLDERTIYNRMQDGEFKALYKSAKADLIRKATVSIAKQLEAAINTIVDVMNDEESSPSTRLQAAQMILNNAGKFSAQLQADEGEVTKQTLSNKFNPF